MHDDDDDDDDDNELSSGSCPRQHRCDTIVLCTFIFIHQTVKLYKAVYKVETHNVTIKESGRWYIVVRTTAAESETHIVSDACVLSCIW